jgi:hypothetical protein
MSASTGHLAAERARLEAEINALSKGLPEGAADIVRKADEIMSAHAERITALKRARDAIDQRFEVTRQEAAEAAAEEHRKRQAARCADLIAFHAAKLDALDRAERHFAQAVVEINAALEAETSERAAGNALSGGVRLRNATNLSPTEFVRRLVGGIAAHLAGITTCRMNRFGAMELPNHSLYPTAEAWSARERRATGPSIEALLEHGRTER